MSVAAEFLEWLRPNGPWQLHAIKPDGPITTMMATTAEDVDRFIKTHDGQRNIYYTVNPIRASMNKKPKKENVIAVENLLSDLDPEENEPADDAKARYLGQLNGDFEPKASAIVDSGNGIQTLWKLTEPILLPDDEKDRAAIIADVEARSAALMVRLGGKPGTQNIDRILRLPGTTNLPNKKKIKAGRVACPTKLLSVNGASYALDAFPKPETHGPGSPEDGGHHAGQQHDGDMLWQAINTDVPVGQRSEQVFKVINEMFRRGYRSEAILRVLLDKKNKISAHIYEQHARTPRKYAQRQIDEAKSKVGLAVSEKNMPYQTAANVCIALLLLGIELCYDEFADRILVSGLRDFAVYNDAAFDRLWLTLNRHFRFNARKDLLRTALSDAARVNGFHPVRDYLDGLQWDGKPRIDTWLSEYGGAEDSEYTRAVAALMLIAAVRRVRIPGCKFDEMVVLENEQQGTNKSTALSVLAIHEDWFSDDLPLNVSDKQVIERLRGHWIVEAAELSGIRTAEIEHLKAFLSRQIDRARMAYDRAVSEVPRQCIIVATTNLSRYLKDPTGNRRFWPVSVQQFNIAKLRHNRDQLWAEAAARETAGASIRLDPELWPKAAAEQEKRTIADPWFDTLQSVLGEFDQAKISTNSIWLILNIRGGQLVQEHSRRVAAAMKRLGWKQNSARTIKLDGKDVVGFTRGDKPWEPIRVCREQDGTLRVYRGDPY